MFFYQQFWSVCQAFVYRSLEALQGECRLLYMHLPSDSMSPIGVQSTCYFSHEELNE